MAPNWHIINYKVRTTRTPTARLVEANGKGAYHDATRRDAKLSAARIIKAILRLASGTKINLSKTQLPACV